MTFHSFKFCNSKEKINQLINVLVCSGLTTISRYPIKNVSFRVFEDQGVDCHPSGINLMKFVSKGIGIITIEPLPEVKVS